MNELQLKRCMLFRYVNVIMVLFFLSEVPMPFDRFALAVCSGVALVFNACLHIYAFVFHRYRKAVYLILVVDVLTIGPAIYFTGMVASPFWVVLPLTLNSVFFVNSNLRATKVYCLAICSLLVVLFGLWLLKGEGVAGWGGQEYPVFTGVVFVIQLIAIMGMAHQAEFFPNPLMQELQRQELMMSRQRHHVELGASLSVVSHEMRNPLATIGLCIEQLRFHLAGMRGAGKAKAMQHVKVCADELARLGEMVEGILAYARDKTDRYSMESVSVDELILRAVDFMKLKYGRHRIGFEVSLDSVYGQSAWCDRDAMHQVLVNLMDNAAQNRSTDRPLSIRCQVMILADRVVIALRDNGMGIAPAMLPHIFDRFATSRAAGTGVGLFVVKKVVEDHGGTVEVQSVEGEGTTFMVALPRKDPPALGGRKGRKAKS